jgi:subunit length determinant Wzz-like protein
MGSRSGSIERRVTFRLRRPMTRCSAPIGPYDGSPPRGKPLEIKDYVGALAGRGRIVAAVAIIVGFLAVVVYILQPQRYKATATIVIPANSSTSTSALAAVSQAYSDFTGALASDQVAQQVATKVGVPASSVKGHLSASRQSGSSVAEVTYTGTNRDQASAIVREGSTDAILLIAQARLAPLNAQVTAAQKNYDDVYLQYKTFLSQTGILNQDRYFARQQAQIINTKNELGSAQAAGDTKRASDLQARLTALQTKAAEEQSTASRIKAEIGSALETLSASQSEALTAQGLVDSISNGGQVSVTDPTAAPRLSGLIKAVVPAVVVAAGLAIALIVLLDVVGPARPAKRRSPDDAGPAPDQRPPSDDDEPEEPQRDPAGRPLRTTA